MNEQAMKFRFGIFVLASLILLAVLIMLFGGVPRYFTQYDSYTIVVDNAMGVTPGTPVRRSGVKIGEVRAVELDNETGKVLLPVLIEHGYTIHEGDRPTIVRGFLGGDVSIDFLPPPEPEPAKQPPAKQPPAKQPAAKQAPPQVPPPAPEDEADDEQLEGDPQVKPGQPVPPGSKLKGYTPPEPGELVQKLTELFPPAKRSLTEMEKVLTKIDKMMPVMEETLKEFRDVARATNRFVPELEKTNGELRELTRTVRQSVPDLKKTGDEFQRTARIWGDVGERLNVLVQTNEAKINKTIDQVEVSSRQLARFLSDENEKNLNQTLKNARVASEQFDSIAKNTDEMIKESRVTIKNLNSTVLKANDVFDDLRKVTRPLADTSPDVMKNLNESSTTLNRTLNDFRDLMRDVARSDGTLQRLISDPSLYNNLNDSACMVNKIIPRLDRILADFEIFADKIARHPESLGIGGVVRPGNGLKEAPTVLPWRETPEPRWHIWSHH
jgi:phospholipid/cholesterol/gamma-HCH transport system substrate-binding protein